MIAVCSLKNKPQWRKAAFTGQVGVSPEINIQCYWALTFPSPASVSPSSHPSGNQRAQQLWTEFLDPEEGSKGWNTDLERKRRPFITLEPEIKINTNPNMVQTTSLKEEMQEFPGGSVVKTSLSNAGSTSSIPGWGAKISHAHIWNKTKQNKTKNIKQKQYCNKFNKDFKMVHIKTKN